MDWISVQVSVSSFKRPLSDSGKKRSSLVLSLIRQIRQQLGVNKVWLDGWKAVELKSLASQWPQGGGWRTQGPWSAIAVGIGRRVFSSLRQRNSPGSDNGETQRSLFITKKEEKTKTFSPLKVYLQHRAMFSWHTGILARGSIYVVGHWNLLGLMISINMPWCALALCRREIRYLLPWYRDCKWQNFCWTTWANIYKQPPTSRWGARGAATATDEWSEEFSSIERK